MLRPLIELLGLPQPTLLSDLVTYLYRTMKKAPQLLGVDGVGLMLADDFGRLRVVGFSDVFAARVEEAQVAVDAGPGVESYTTGEPVAVYDINEQPGYGALRERMTTSGMRALLSCPIHAGHAVIISTPRCALRTHGHKQRSAPPRSTPN